MGVDLTLLPYDHESEFMTFSHTVITLERRRELWEPIGKVESDHGQDVPNNFTCFLGRGEDGDTTYGIRTHTPYGNRMKFVTANELMHVCSHEGVTDNYRNRAAWAYLKELPPDTKIALYWH